MTTRTPTRAITKTLTARSSPSISPTSQSYENCVKTTLRHRLIYNIFASSAAFSWFLAVLFSRWNSSHGVGVSGLLISTVRPTTVALAAANWAVGALPVIILRKVYLTTTPTAGSSPAQTLKNALAKSSTTRALVTYAASAVLICALHASLAEPSARLSFFIKSRKHPYHVNARLLFLLISQLTLSLIHTLRTVLLDRFLFRPQPQSSMSVLPLLVLPALFVAALLLPILSLPVALSLFVPLKYMLGLRGYMGWLGLLVRSWVLGVGTVGAWEAAESTFDIIIPQPTDMARTTASPAHTLVSALAPPTSPSLSQFPAMGHFALSELASFEAPQRAAVFNEPGLWGALVRAGLITLGNDYQRLLRKGAPEPIPAPATAVSNMPKEPETPRLTLISKAIYRDSAGKGKGSPLSKVIDALAAEGDVPETADSAMSLPELFRSVASSPENVGASRGVKESKVGEQEKSAEVEVVQWAKAALIEWVRGSTVGKIVLGFGFGDKGKMWKEWWTRERPVRIASSYLPNQEVDALWVKVLAQSTCASLAEDTYGVVQRDIPRILEAFLSFLEALEAYQAELATSLAPEEKEGVTEVLAGLTDALKDGVASIVRTFGDKLLAFKFPPRIARKLQGFVDYN